MNEDEKALLESVITWRYRELTGWYADDSLTVVRDAADRVLEPRLRSIGVVQVP